MKLDEYINEQKQMLEDVLQSVGTIAKEANALANKYNLEFRKKRYKYTVYYYMYLNDKTDRNLLTNQFYIDFKNLAGKYNVKISYSECEQNVNAEMQLDLIVPNYLLAIDGLLES